MALIDVIKYGCHVAIESIRHSQYRRLKALSTDSVFIMKFLKCFLTYLHPQHNLQL